MRANACFVRFTRPCRRRHAAQALVEFLLISTILIFLLFGLIDFGRALMVRQVMDSVSREGANLASRGTSFTATLNALAVSANPLTIDQNGFIILTAVTRDDTGALTITAQQSRGGQSQSSRIGALGGGGVALPNSTIPQPGQTLIVAEVVYSFQPVTPVGRLLGRNIPSTLYDVSYF